MAKSLLQIRLEFPDPMRQGVVSMLWENSRVVSYRTGKTIAEADPADSLGVRIDLDTWDGSAFVLEITSHGNYGDLGQYKVIYTFAPVFDPPVWRYPDLSWMNDGKVN